MAAIHSDAVVHTDGESATRALGTVIQHAQAQGDAIECRPGYSSTSVVWLRTETMNSVAGEKVSSI